MFKKIKKVIAFALALTMLMGMGTVAFAAESESEVPELTKVDGMTVAIEEDNDDGISPLWWSGDGPAPQVTKIELYDHGLLDNGNYCVIIKVYGYGSDTTTFNGRSISWFKKQPFIISGNGADGFYYWYDCGKITTPGNYTFATKFRSTNFPYGEKSFSCVFKKS